MNKVGAAASVAILHIGVMLAAAQPPAVDVTADSVTRPVADAPMPEGLGRLRIVSVPDDAIVTLDSADRGRTPLLIDSLTPGEHELQIKKKGYFIKKARVLVEAGKQQDVSLELARPCRLVVSSQPAGAALSLNGQDVGVTPWVGDRLAPADYQIKLEAAGFETVSEKKTLASGAVDSLHYVLVKAGGQAAAQPASAQQARTGKSLVMTVVSVSVFLAFSLVVLIVELAR